MMKTKWFFPFLVILFSFFVLDLQGAGNAFDKRVEAIVQKITPALIEIRRDIHAHPELAFQEKRTAAIVAEYFQKLGLEVRTGIAGTGVLGILRGEKEGPVVGVRGDMDALPITEETDLPFRSKEKAVFNGREVGLMHACGHDIHTTLLLGVAHVLSELRSELEGTVLFVAQPAEEFGDGAARMLKAGVFRDIRPEAMFAFHVEDTARAGVIKYATEYAGANVDGFDLVIESEGCHGSSPHECVDPVVVGAQVVTALQVMVAREIDVHNHTVITVGSFHAGAAANVIPERAELKATVRSYGEGQRLLIKEKVERLVKNICEAAGAAYTLDYRIGTPALRNDPGLVQRILPTIERVLGGKEYVQLEPPIMGGEDFSYFAREIPSVMLWLGVVPENVEKTSVHSPTFIADEKSIPIGVKVMSAIILDYFRSGPGKR
ncbi:MAG: amidohydrolase [Candidatus Aminicenantes bacterium]|nr:amidohydrolase [Candidatus Aminicenantes bacterium]